MNIITNPTGINNTIMNFCRSFFRRFGVKKLLRKSGIVKKRGVEAYLLFAFLLGLVFSGKNLYEQMKTEDIEFDKDAVYRFLGMEGVNWERLLSALGAAVIAEINNLTSDERKTALIIDDTSYYRNRSKKVELLSRCKDHVNNNYYNGYTLLTMGWSDGQTFIPVDFRMVASGKDENLICGTQKPQDKRTIATKRRLDARKPKPDLVIDMLCAVKDTPADCKHVLFDSWFSSPIAFLRIKETGHDTIARLKKVNHKYTFNGEKMTISQIYKTNKKRRGRSRYLLSVEVTIEHKDYKEDIPAKIVFVRNKNKRKDWIALLSTDTSLTEDEIVALYGKRWDIEPFFKVCKSYLRLEKEFQTRSFDAIVAHTSIVFSRYIMLALENRESKDQRSVCAIFHAVCKELEDISFEAAFDIIMTTMVNAFRDYMHIENSQMDALADLFMSRLPAYITEKLGRKMVA